MTAQRRHLPGSGLRLAALRLAAKGLRLPFLLMWVGLPGWVAAQESGAVLAPPGECATKRSIVVGLIDPEFSIVGPVAALLDPIDVASPPAPALRPPPPTRRIPHPGPCDSPASGCNPGPVASRPANGSPPPVNPPVQPGNRPTPNPPISGGSRPLPPGSSP